MENNEQKPIDIKFFLLGALTALLFYAILEFKGIVEDHQIQEQNQEQSTPSGGQSDPEDTAVA